MDTQKYDIAMGIWSHPLTVSCIGRDGEHIDCSDVRLSFDEKNDAYNLCCHNVGLEKDIDFFSSIMRTCNTARIYGYLEDAELGAWDDYFDTLMAMNPDVEIAEAHFFCRDLNFPYYARMERGCALRWFKVHRGNMMCYSLKCDDGGGDDHWSLDFNANDYVDMVRNFRQILEMLSDECECTVKHGIMCTMAMNGKKKKEKEEEEKEKMEKNAI